MKDTSGSGQDAPLLGKGPVRFSTDWSRDGRFLVYVEISAKNGSDLWVLPDPGGRDPKPTPFLESPFNEAQGQFSPDSHWIAYASDESGRYEVYVRPFPAAAGKWKISISGGELPRWRRDGKELFYLSPDSKLMSAVVKAVPGAKPVFEVAAPQALFDTRAPKNTPGFNQFPYAVAADGKRILVNNSLREANEAPLTVVVNWLAAVKK